MEPEASPTKSVADHVILTFGGRVMQLIGIPLVLWLLYSAGGDLNTLKTDMAGLKGAFAARIETAQRREQLQDERIAAVESYFRRR